LLPSLAPLLHEWLPRQRWFAGKGRAVTGFRLVAATEMVPLDGTAGPGLLHLLLRVEQPSRSVRAADDCYQLLLGVRTSLPPVLAGALVGRVERGPLAGRTVYDALHDPRLADVLLERFRRPGSL
ncbi:maltokinase, partial [Streptomyces sp. SID7982]|nr:maltokinase [Streptomyces sp. SID7982]